MCPFHDDRKASFSVNRATGLWHCFAENVGGTVRDFGEQLRVEPPSSNSKSAESVFDYRDEKGALLYQVVRFAGKQFRQRKPDGKGDWIWNIHGVRRVPYRLPELLNSAGNVFIVEGEKDVETLRAKGFAATCNAGGAGKWRDEFGQHLRGRVCILIADNDEPGRAHVEDVARKLAPYAQKVINLGTLPESPEKGDVSDWFADGHELGVLLTLVDRADGHDNSGVCSNGHGVANSEWPEPEALGADLLPVPKLVDDAIPAPLREWIADVAERFQCPVDYLAPPMIIAAGMLIGRKLAIRPKQHDDWREYPNLWGVIVGSPGMMKSPALEEALRPLKRIERDAHERYREEATDQSYRKSLSDIARTRIDEEMKKRVKAGRPTDDLRDELRKVEYQQPVERRYTVSDASVEKLGELLIAHPNGLLLVRDELSGWLWRLESEEHKSERGFYLERWSGKEPIRVDRIGRGSLCGEASCLSIVGGLTPQTLGQLVAGVYSGARNDGMLQRFQLAIYPDLPGPFRNVDREPMREARERVYRLFACLDSMSADCFKAHDDGEGNFYLRFESEAQELFNQWRGPLEARVRDPNEHDVLVSHLAKYRSLVPGLALIFHAIDVADGREPAPVSAEALARALMWSEYLEAHALRIYQGAMQPAETAAGILAKRIREQSFPEVFSIRDVMRKHWSGLTRKESVLGALEIAEEAGWVRREPAAPGTFGRPSERFRVNPKVRV
jgi:putative DNA primase/helicase